MRNGFGCSCAILREPISPRAASWALAPRMPWPQSTAKVYAPVPGDGRALSWADRCVILIRCWGFRNRPIWPRSRRHSASLPRNTTPTRARIRRRRRDLPRSTRRTRSWATRRSARNTIAVKSMPKESRGSMASRALAPRGQVLAGAGSQGAARDTSTSSSTSAAEAPAERAALAISSPTFSGAAQARAAGVEQGRSPRLVAKTSTRAQRSALRMLRRERRFA